MHPFTAISPTSRHSLLRHSHACFAAMNGVLITFRNYPGRSKDEVAGHMKKPGKIIALKFKS